MRDLLYVAFRHKFKICAVFLGVFGLVVLYTFLKQEIYRSEAKILIRLGRENLSIDPSVSGPTLYPLTNRESEVNSELAILQSRELAESVVDALGPDRFLLKPDEIAEVEPPSPVMKEAQQELRAIRREVRQTQESGSNILVAMDIATPLTPRERAIKLVMENTAVNAEAKADIISVSFDSPSRDLAQQALAKMLDLYLEKHIEVHSTQATPEFFEGQTVEYRGKLTTAEQNLARFRDEFGISDMAHQKIVLLEQIANLETQFATTKSQLSASQERVASIEKTLAGRSPMLELSRVTGRPNYAADAMKEKLLELKLTETDLAARYPDTHRPLMDVRKQISEAEAALSGETETHTEVTTGVDTTFQELQFALENERAQAASFAGQRAIQEQELGELRNTLRVLTGREHELATLEREVELAERDYEEFRESLQRARISNAMDLSKVSNVGVVQPATLPMQPAKPNKVLNLFLGVFLALFAAIAFGFTVDYLDDSVNAPEQIEKWVGVPVLATVSDKEYRACI